MEIHDWLVADVHKEDVILLHINDEGQRMDWGHIDLVQQPVQTIFGGVIFTPLDKGKYFPGRWYVCEHMHELLVSYGDFIVWQHQQIA